MARRSHFVAPLFLGLLGSLSASCWVGVAVARQGIVELTPDTFPALVDCRANTLAVEETCPRYETILIKYQIPDGEVLAAGDQLRLTFGWRYDGQYLTDRRYTRLFGWPAPQTTMSSEPNYASALVRQRDEPRTIVDSEFGTLIVSFDRDVTAKSRIEITLGDTSSGSPGHLVPALPGEIDLVLTSGSEERGFSLVSESMPTLRIVGTRVDGFRVLAPTTAKGEFDLVVQALEGIEGPRTNRALVPGYTGTVSLSSSDRRASLPATYTFTVADGGVARIPVTLSRGIHTVTVEETGTSHVATSNPVVVRTTLPPLGKAPTAIVRSRRNVYWGVLQQHTAVGGHGAQTPEFAYGHARDVQRLDFLALTEHCATPAYRPQHSNEVARRYDEPGRFVTFEAFEWASLEYGHRHVLYRDGRDQPNLCDRDEGVNPTVMAVPTLEDLQDALTGQDALVVVHHTAWHQPSEGDRMADVQLGDSSWSQQGLFEIFSHHGSSECADNAPYVIHANPLDQWPADKKVFFRDALQMGFRFGVVSGTDNHLGMPGGQVDGAQPYSRSGITAVYADALTHDDLWAAMKARRTYGTTGARILLEFSMDGREMGEEYASSRPLGGRIFVAGTDVIDRVDVFRNGHDLVHTFAGGMNSGTYRFTEPALPAGQVRSYYVRVTQADDHIAWSSPIWVRGEDVPPVVTALRPVVPNPSNPASTILYSLAMDGPVRIVIYDLAGRLVRTLVDRQETRGNHSATWSGTDDHGRAVSSGVYLVQMQAGVERRTRKFMLLR